MNSCCWCRCPFRWLMVTGYFSKGGVSTSKPPKPPIPILLEPVAMRQLMATGHPPFPTLPVTSQRPAVLVHPSPHPLLQGARVNSVRGEQPSEAQAQLRSSEASNGTITISSPLAAGDIQRPAVFREVIDLFFHSCVVRAAWLIPNCARFNFIPRLIGSGQAVLHCAHRTSTF